MRPVGQSARWTAIPRSMTVAGTPFTVVDASGTRCTWDSRAALIGEVERVQQQQEEGAPCPDGWSRIDYFFGHGAECSVPTRLRDALDAVNFVLGVTITFCFAFQLWRKRCKGETRSSMYRAVTLIMASCMALTIMCGANVLQIPFDHRMTLACHAAADILCCNYVLAASEAFLNNAIDTLYPLRPARAAVWRGRVALVHDVVRPAYTISFFFSGACVAIGHATRHEALSHRGMAGMAGTQCIVSLLACGMMVRGAIGTGHAARKLGQSVETLQLRKKLARQRKAATILALFYASITVGWVPVVVHRDVRRTAGILFHVYLVPCWTCCLVAMLPGVLRSMRRLCQARRVAHTNLVSVAPQRRISAVAAATPATGPAVSLARRGVSLAFLRALVKQQGVGARVTTGEVCETFVKPATAAARCAYYELLQHSDTASLQSTTGPARETERWAGESHYFLSHSWSYRFHELLAILESFEEQTKPEHTVYYWFDIFVMNQHRNEDLNQHSLLKHLVDSIKGPGRVLLAMDSWRDPSPLTRVWCLLEIFTAMEQGVELTMCFSSAEQANFAEKLQAQSQAEVQRVLERVDAEKAEATVESDREAIFAMIRGNAGFTRFNRTIRDALRRSFERVVIAQRRL